jgi:alcohol dehydrogenase (NADP+)
MKTLGYAAQNATAPLVPFNYLRREPGPCDVHIKILYCGVCHTDLHLARNEWNNTEYSIVPGHEYGCQSGIVYHLTVTLNTVLSLIYHC